MAGQMATLAPVEFDTADVEEALAGPAAESTSRYGIEDSCEFTGQRVAILSPGVFADPAGGGVLTAETGQRQAEEERAPARVAAHGFEYRVPGVRRAVSGPGSEGDQGRGQPVLRRIDHQALGCPEKGGRADRSRCHGPQHPGSGTPDHLVMTELTIVVGAGLHQSRQRVLPLPGGAIVPGLRQMPSSPVSTVQL